MSRGCGPECRVYPRCEILDSQGEAFGAALVRMGYGGEVDEVRRGKTFDIELRSPDAQVADDRLEEIARNCWHLERLLGAAERGGVSTREVELVRGDRLPGRANGGGCELAVEDLHGVWRLALPRTLDL